MLVKSDVLFLATVNFFHVPMLSLRLNFIMQDHLRIPCGLCCRHSDSKSSTRNGGSFSAAENNIADVYPLQLRLSIQREANILGVRISKKVASLPYQILLILDSMTSLIVCGPFSIYNYLLN